MARDHNPDFHGDCVRNRATLKCAAWSVAAIVCVVSGIASGAPAGERPPYGTFAEIQQCVADMQASLHGRSILGSRDTAAYIQDRGNLEDIGVTEYDVMVGRCKTRFFHRYNQLHGR